MRRKCGPEQITVDVKLITQLAIDLLNYPLFYACNKMYSKNLTFTWHIQDIYVGLVSTHVMLINYNKFTFIMVAIY